MKLIYVGAHSGVIVQLPGGGATIADKGKTVDLPDSVAGGLIERGDWEYPPAPVKATDKGGKNDA